MSGDPPPKLVRRKSLDGFNYQGGHTSSILVMEQDIDWFDYARDLGGSVWLSQDQAALLSDFDQAPLADQVALWEQYPEDYALTFLKACSSISIEPTLQYLLTILQHFLQQQPSQTKSFTDLQTDSLSVFMSIIDTHSYQSYTRQTAARILTALITHLSNPADLPQLSKLVLWALEILRAPSHEQELTIALNTLKDLSKDNALRAFLVQQRLPQALCAVLDDSRFTSDHQLMYLVGFVLWLLSFDQSSFPEFAAGDVVGRVVGLLKRLGREKLVRIMAAFLVNLSVERSFVQVMVVRGLPKVLQGLEGRKWTDEDVLGDLHTLNGLLEEEISAMSTWSMFEKELDSRCLRWSPMHSERFWKENVQESEERDFHVIRQLIALLASDDDETAAVACYDLGEFARRYPGGKKVLARLRGKEKLMLQLSHVSPAVQKQALLAVQKVMVNNWSFLAQN